MDRRGQHSSLSRESPVAERTALSRLALDNPNVRKSLQKCERKKYYDPWNPLMMFLSPRELSEFPAGYPTKAGSSVDRAVPLRSQSCPSMGDATSINKTSTSKTSSGKSVFSDNTSCAQTEVTTEVPARLWCEHRDLLGCNVEFPPEEQDRWIEHHKEHLKHNYPERLKCCLCSDAFFDVDVRNGHDYYRNFTLRMLHIAEHMIYEHMPSPTNVWDPLMLDHLLHLGIITEDKKPRLADMRTSDSDNVPSSSSTSGVGTRSVYSNDNNGGPKQSRELDVFGIDSTRHGYMKKMTSISWLTFKNSDSLARLGQGGIWIPTNLDLICVDIFAYTIPATSEVFDEFLFSFNGWLDWTLTLQSDLPSGNAAGRGADNNAEDGNEDGNEENNLTPNESSAPGRKKNNKGGGNGGKGKRDEKLTPHDMARLRYFACPYLKKDPHGVNRDRCITGWATKDFHRIK